MNTILSDVVQLPEAAGHDAPCSPLPRSAAAPTLSLFAADIEPVVSSSVFCLTGNSVVLLDRNLGPARVCSVMAEMRERAPHLAHLLTDEAGQAAVNAAWADEAGQVEDDRERGSAGVFGLLMTAAVLSAFLGAFTLIGGAVMFGLALMALTPLLVIAACGATLAAEASANAARTPRHRAAEPVEDDESAPDDAPAEPVLETVPSDSGSIEVGAVVVVFIAVAALMPLLDAITPAVTR